MQELRTIVDSINSKHYRLVTEYHLVTNYGFRFDQISCVPFEGCLPRMCFYNSQRIAVSKGLTYCEGFAIRYGIPIHHAWVCDPNENGFEVTWDDTVAVYYGVKINLKYATYANTCNNYSGVLDRLWVQRQLQYEKDINDIFIPRKRDSTLE